MTIICIPGGRPLAYSWLFFAPVSLLYFSADAFCPICRTGFIAQAKPRIPGFSLELAARSVGLDDLGKTFRACWNVRRTGLLSVGLLITIWGCQRRAEYDD